MGGNELEQLANICSLVYSSIGDHYRWRRTAQIIHLFDNSAYRPLEQYDVFCNQLSSSLLAYLGRIFPLLYMNRVKIIGKGLGTLTNYPLLLPRRFYPKPFYQHFALTTEGMIIDPSLIREPIEIERYLETGYYNDPNELEIINMQ